MGCVSSSPHATKIIQQCAVDCDKILAKSEDSQYQAKLRFLSKVQLMKLLPRDQHPLVASACTVQHFKPGETVIRQGDLGDEFFIIRAGQASVQVSGDLGGVMKVAILKVGDYFGENALIRNEPRSATVIAEGDLSIFTITRRRFQELGLNEKLQFPNRRAVGVKDARKELSKPLSPKSASDRNLIKSALLRNENLHALVTLDDARASALVDVAWREAVKADQEIIKEGDLNADSFYIVASGSFEVWQSSGSEPEEEWRTTALCKQDSKVVSSAEVGDSFGELALLYLVPRAASVKAKEDSVVWVIGRSDFKRILMNVSDNRLRQYVRYLDDVDVLSPLLRDEKHELARALVEVHYLQSEVVVQQGEPGKNFYILYEGSVSITKDGQALSELTASPASGAIQYFGERALLDNEVRAATVRVTSESAKVLVLDRDDFDLLLGPLKDIIALSRSQGAQRASMVEEGGVVSSSRVKLVEEKRHHISRKELNRVGFLGAGGFGVVELFEHKVTKATFALKGVSKGYIVKCCMQESVLHEKNILLMTNSPFIVKLYETYSSPQTLYFLLEPCLGGELFTTYKRRNLFGSEKHAKFYVAGVVFAFEHLHERRIIYRDLKPENLLLTDEGRIKLTDMGLAKMVVGKTFTTCGTPDYFAPELIATTGHTNALDWWTLGVLIFELMSGHTPFESKNVMQIYAKVRKGIARVPFPSKCRGDCGDLIRALLKNEPSERLPMRPGGTWNIKEHRWLRNFDWEGMRDMTLVPPYRPIVKSRTDLANFGVQKDNMPRQVPYDARRGGNWDKGFATAD